MKFDRGLKSIVFVSAILLVCLSGAIASVTSGEVKSHSFNAISTIEYTSKVGQYRSQASTLFDVEKTSMENNVVSYSITSPDLSGLPEGFDKRLSFVVDRSNRKIASESRDLSLIEYVNNQCVQSFKKLTPERAGTSWKQSFKLSVPGLSLPKSLDLNLSATSLKSKSQGDLLAVRALSKPFDLTVKDSKGKESSIKCKIGTVYLFDASVEDIYLSISVFEASTNMNGYSETLRHEVATYRTNEYGKAVDLKGMGKEFEKFVRKVGLKTKPVVVTKKTALPEWARSEVLPAAKASNICAATACEGALNPVVSICAATTQAMTLQSAGFISSGGAPMLVSKSLVQAVPGMGGMKIAMAPFMGVGMGTAGAIGGGSAAGIAAGGGGGGGSRGGADSP